jgi:hypothetical protein
MTAPRHCVITGAADGIGRALALRYAAAGYQITGIDVDTEQAERTRAELVQAGAQARFLHGDLASEVDIEHMLTALADSAPPDVFIHNAGISAAGPFASSDLARQQAVLDVNLLAPLLLTAGLLRWHLLAPRASLVFITSLSFFVGYPGAAVYAASKDGLASYARSLSVALAAQGFHVLTVYPGPTRTAHARRYSPDNRREARRMPPERLADDIFRAVQQRRRTLIPGSANRLLAVLGRYAPGLVERMMRKTLLEPLERLERSTP